MHTAHERFKQVKKIGLKNRWTEDIYHILLMSTWTQFFLTYMIFFTLFNLFFGTLYWINTGGLSGTDGSFWHSYIFSVQTFSTVGYGVFSPHSDVAHSIVVLESILSVFVTAVLTGLLFAKFSRPTARIIYSKNVLINNFDGKKMLMFRMGNLRANQIAEAQVKLVALKSIKTPEGQTIRRQLDLTPIRSSSLFFVLTWTVMHVIDETSPYFGLTAEDIKKQNLELAVSVIGYDASFSQTIHSNIIYGPDDFEFDKYFEDTLTVDEKGVSSVDYNKFHSLKA